MGNYSVQLQDKAHKQPMREETFPDFSALFAFVSKFDKSGPDGINIHLPASSSDDERDRIIALGFMAN